MIEWDKPEPREEKHRARRSIGQAASIAGSETSCRDGLLATDTVEVRTHQTWKIPCRLSDYILEVGSESNKERKKHLDRQRTSSVSPTSSGIEIPHGCHGTQLRNGCQEEKHC